MGIRRNGKWHWALTVLALTGLAGGVLSAAAQTPDAGSTTDSAAQGPHDGPGGPHRLGHGFHPGGMVLDRPLLLSFRRLDLTDEQWQRVQAILEVQRLRRGAGNETPQQRQAQVAALFDPGSPQHAAAVQTMKDRAIARIDQAAHAQEALYEVLTPAQKTQLQQLTAQRRQRLAEHRQHGYRGHGADPGHDDDGATAPPPAQ